MLLRIHLEAETPLSFRDGEDMNQGAFSRYVPGASLYGALAGWQGMQRPDDPAQFANFFSRDLVRLSNVYPANFDLVELQNELLPVEPLPLTARSCKRFKGFAYGSDNKGERAGVTDGLIPLALFALSNETRPELLASLREHPTTGQPLDRIEGFFRMGGDGSAIGQGKTASGLRTRTGINYRTGTAYQSTLYSRQTLAEESQFWGCWYVDDGLTDSFTALVHEMVEQRALRIGNNRSRGFGRVRLDMGELPGDTAVDLEARALAFTRLLQAEAEQASLAIPAGLYLPITLTADMLLVDDVLRPRLQLSPADLAAAGVPGAQLLFHAANARRVRSWNHLLGLPRADAWALTMGSVFLFHLPQADATTWQALLKLQLAGLGQRRAEGFGSLVVAHRFHTELHGVYR